MGNANACAARSDELYLYLCSALDKNATLTIKQKEDPESWCFCIYFHGKSDASFDGISVSVPIDVPGNRKGQSVNTFETALFLNDSRTFNSDLGYDDVRLYYSMKDVMDEILRLATIQNKNTMSVSVPSPISVNATYIYGF